MPLCNHVSVTHSRLEERRDVRWERGDDGLEDIKRILLRLLSGEETLEGGQDGLQLLLGHDHVRRLGHHGRQESRQGRHISPCFPRTRSQNVINQLLKVARELLEHTGLEKHREDLEDKGDEL